MRLTEMFEDDKEQLSIAKVIMLGCFLVAAIIMLTLTWQKEMSEGYFTLFVGFGGGVYGYGKSVDNKTIRGKKK